jgi:hypothetical protein
MGATTSELWAYGKAGREINVYTNATQVHGCSAMRNAEDGWGGAESGLRHRRGRCGSS